jgi:hypothetical protein
MKEIAKRYRLGLWGVLAGTFLLAPAVAEMAKVRLKDGTVMRGELELTEAEALIRNEAGVVRCPRERVDHIDWLEPAKTVQSDYMRRFWALAPGDVKGHFALAKWLVERKALELARTQCEHVLKLDPQHDDAKRLLEEVKERLAGGPGEQPVGEQGAEPSKGEPSQQRYKGVPPPPPLSPRDILRLKLSEIKLDGPAERLGVRFLKLRGEPDVEQLVREEMVNAADYDPDWAQTLAKGQPHEKLQVILKATGLKYADRIEIRGHPRTFSTYRRRVLPLVIRGCARSGCHGGYTAQVFRFPRGPQSSDGFVYTSFALLDGMQTAVGPMIDRALPEQSALLRYMLPAEEGQQLHPPVKSGRVTPTLRGTRDPTYQVLVDWLSSLRSPHPDYELEYQFPEWFEPLSKQQREPLTVGQQPAQAAAEEKPAEEKPPEEKPQQQKPAGEPGSGDQEKPDEGGNDKRP